MPLRDLVVVNLKYSPGSEPYRDIAYAQLCAKALYSGGNTSQYPRGLAGDIATVLGVRKIPLPAVERGLSYLLSKGTATHEDGRWVLTPDGVSRVQSDIARSANRARTVLERHYPTRIQADKLMEWHHQACADFFGAYADRWVSAKYKGVTPRSKLPSNLEAALRPSATRCKLENEMHALVSGFEALLSSSNPEDSEELYCAAMAMFASRLVAANISADPLTLSLVRDSVLLLDTNVLFAAQLERHRLASSLTALGTALASIGVELRYTFRTRQEYIRALSSARDRTIRVVRSFSPAVVAGAKDDWIATARARHCQVVGDYETFFDDLTKLPEQIGESASLEELDTPDVAATAAAGEADEALKAGIQSYWLKLRHRRKRVEPTKHDAALIHVGRHIRQTGRVCYILTLDHALCEYGRDSSGPHEMPLTVSLDALLQILAVDYSGIGSNPAAFAPLMARMLSMQFEPGSGSYTLEDLAWLLDIEERAAGLADERVEELATTICKARLSGRPADDPEVRLAIQRGFQADRLTFTQELASAQSMVKSRADEATEWRGGYAELRMKTVDERAGHLRTKAWIRAILRAVLLLAAATVLSLLLLQLATAAFGNDERSPVLWWNLLTGAGPIIGGILGIMLGVIPKLKRELADARSRATAQLDSEMPRPGTGEGRSPDS